MIYRTNNPLVQGKYGLVLVLDISDPSHPQFKVLDDAGHVLGNVESAEVDNILGSPPRGKVTIAIDTVIVTGDVERAFGKQLNKIPRTRIRATDHEVFIEQDTPDSNSYYSPYVVYGEPGSNTIPMRLQHKPLLDMQKAGIDSSQPPVTVKSFTQEELAQIRQSIVVSGNFSQEEQERFAQEVRERLGQTLQEQVDYLTKQALDTAQQASPIVPSKKPQRKRHP